ncbi:hypothetical protein [Vibrio parahaemolyticus]|uniref:hypothetical protein n=1 Tax=Vibrio parahaemolyticus TaxID=670 RepID=UPI00387A83CC|nr:hypothetical protein [Vibrio parahaemolyticus]HCE4545002.1 hypothetical protein [Vibrio parahaemolyticus]HCH2589885.1 hypothetical protein [Vibrio parahaemolyticus]
MHTEPPKNRYQLMNALGATQRNIYWSWCAEDKDNKRLFFTAWEHENIAPTGEEPIFIIQHPKWGIKDNGKFSNSRKDHNDKIQKYFDGLDASNLDVPKHTAYCYFTHAKINREDKSNYDIEIRKVLRNYIYEINLIKVPCHLMHVHENENNNEHIILGLTKGRKLYSHEYENFKNNPNYSIGSHR